jgi:hypothetical protein
MTSRSFYVGGLAAIAILTLAVALAVPGGARSSLLLALLLAFALQAPLGWWLVRSVGTDRVMVVWGTGVGARVAVVGAMGLIGVRALGLAPTAVLVPLVSLLVALLALEASVLLFAQSRAEVG